MAIAQMNTVLLLRVIFHPIFFFLIFSPFVLMFDQHNKMSL